MTDVSKVNRVEVIDNIDGRQYTKWDLQDVELSLQDEDRTLKVFVTVKKDKN